MKLWILLQTHYQFQGFVDKLGLCDGETANLWWFEFQKNKIDFNEFVLIGNNLGELSKPEFIPNVFELIALAKRLKKQTAEQCKRHTAQHFMSSSEIQDLREKTKKTRINSIELMRKNLNQRPINHV